MNIVGSTSVTPMMDAALRTQGDHEGKSVFSATHAASQNGSKAATYPPARDLVRSAASVSHFPSVSSSLRNRACATPYLSRTTAGTASANLEMRRTANPVE